MRTIFVRIETRTGDDSTSINMDDFGIFDDEKYHQKGYFPSYTVQLNEDLPDPIPTRICIDLTKALPVVNCKHTLKVLKLLKYKHKPIYKISCDACKVAADDVKTCKFCKVYKFCPTCMKSENHTGTFCCKICDKMGCNNSKSPQTPVGHLDDFEYCWPCFVSISARNLRIGTNNLKASLTPTQSQNLDKLTESVIAMATSTL